MITNRKKKERKKERKKENIIKERKFRIIERIRIRKRKNRKCKD